MDGHDFLAKVDRWFRGDASPPRIRVSITRHSVAMGDDTWAPHTWAFEINTSTTLGELAQIAIDGHYLASIVSGRASWVMQAAGGRALAVLAQQWSVPRWLADPAIVVIHIPDAYDAGRGQADLHFDYRAQVDPAELFRSLMDPQGGREFGNVFAPSRRAQPHRPPKPS
ncbi:hypothetical protein ABIB25_003827 [Nakamurella sp. UYEF19]|uniref:hypothetical protein n=1 Tax=Nakamurella sp. UYEF19 TaxID=1756392 RepID=UPI003392AF5C